MKVVILAGGLGSRLSEETDLRPKPMVEIGGYPILWHIMKIYSYYGFNDFVICLGYKGSVIRDYFMKYPYYRCDMSINIRENKYKFYNNLTEPWNITFVDTGENTMTGGRIKRIKNYIKDDSEFLLTYGDGVANLNIKELVKYHKRHNKLATVTGIKSSERFGVISKDKEGIVKKFNEKPKEENSLISGGFFVLSTKVLEYIEGDKTVWEKGPMEILTKNNNLKVYEHKGFWQCMDTLRDKNSLEKFWKENKALWKLWE